MNDIDNSMSKMGIDNGGRSLIDLDGIKDHSGFDLDGYTLTKVFDDIVLIDFIDTDETGLVKKDALYVQTSKTIKTWRKGKIVLAGQMVTQCSPGDIVIFPNDNGVQVSNINAENYGIVKRGVFIAESRLFGVCKKQ